MYVLKRHTVSAGVVPLILTLDTTLSLVEGVRSVSRAGHYSPERDLDLLSMERWAGLEAGA
jgi:hypothetical protein